MGTSQVDLGLFINFRPFCTLFRLKRPPCLLNKTMRRGGIHPGKPASRNVRTLKLNCLEVNLHMREKHPLLEGWFSRILTGSATDCD